MKQLTPQLLAQIACDIADQIKFKNYNSQSTFYALQEDDKEHLNKLVAQYLENPELTPEEQHKKWLHDMAQLNWGYGPVLDPQRKQHPQFKEFDDLPEDIKTMRLVFAKTVRLFAAFVQPTGPQKLADQPLSAHQAIGRQMRRPIPVPIEASGNYQQDAQNLLTALRETLGNIQLKYVVLSPFDTIETANHRKTGVQIIDFARVMLTQATALVTLSEEHMQKAVLLPLSEIEKKAAVHSEKLNAGSPNNTGAPGTAITQPEFIIVNNSTTPDELRQFLGNYFEEFNGQSFVKCGGVSGTNLLIKPGDTITKIDEGVFTLKHMEKTASSVAPVAPSPATTSTTPSTEPAAAPVPQADVHVSKADSQEQGYTNFTGNSE